MAEKRLGVAMKAAQKFPKIKVVYSNEVCTGNVSTMKARQKRLLEKLRLLYHEENRSWKFY